jgi:hypothetical protein
VLLTVIVIEDQPRLDFESRRFRQAHHLSMGEHVPVGVDGSIEPPGRHIAVLVAPGYSISNPSGTSWNDSVRAQVITMNDIEE